MNILPPLIPGDSGATMELINNHALPYLLSFLLISSFRRSNIKNFDRQDVISFFAKIV